MRDGIADPAITDLYRRLAAAYACYTKVGLFVVGVPVLQTLRRAGDSLVMTVPKAFVEQNQLSEGSTVVLHIDGSSMKVDAMARPSYTLAELLAETPDVPHRVDGWENMPAVGLEHDY